MNEPTVTFSDWVAWRDRASLKSPDRQASMGVYLWAKFDRVPERATVRYPELPRELIYVGETNDLNLRPLGPRPHLHLNKYRLQYPDDPRFERLYLSVCHVGPFQPKSKSCHALRAFTRYLEARIGWEYTQRFEKRPRLDYKTGKDEFALEE